MYLCCFLTSLCLLVATVAGSRLSCRALGVFYNIKAAITEHDFYNGDITTPIEITVEYRDLNTDEQNEFSTYLNGGTLAVTKRISLQDGKLDQRYFAATKQIPVLAEMRGESGVTAKRNAWNRLVEAAELPDIGPLSVRGDDPEEHARAYEERHPELTADSARSTVFRAAQCRRRKARQFH